MPSLPDIDELWDYTDPASSEAKLRERLPQFESAGDVALHAELLTQIARAQGLRRNFDEAHHTLDQVEKILTPNMGRAKIRYLLERGRVLNSSKRADEAKPLFLEALRAGEDAHEDGLTVDAMHMVAIVTPPDESLTWNLKAMALAESSTDPKARKWRGSLYNNMGWTYHDKGQHMQALDLFEKQLAFRREQGDPVLISIARWCVARCLRSLNRIDEALDIQLDLEKTNEAAGGGDGYNFEELGELLLIKGRKEEAQKYFAKAYEKLSADIWLKKSEPARLERLQKLSGLR